MTDQTVPVPLDLIEAIRVLYPAAAASQGSVLNEIVELIPAPPKVGDTLTKEQIEALPGRSVIRDRDDDIWVTDGEGTVSLLTFYDTTGRPADGGGDAEKLAGYAPVLVSLPVA